MNDCPAPPTRPATRIDRLRRRHRQIITAVTVLLVAGILGSAAVVGYRRWQQHYLNRNESAVIAALKNISSAQAQCQASGFIDRNGNGQGEYGFLAELAGSVPARGTQKSMQPPVLSRAFGELANGRVERSGYVFQMFLPDREARGVAEDARGGDPDDDNGVHPGSAETMWCCYAWPREHGFSGQRVFFINQGGDVLTTNCATTVYDGPHAPCPFDAAFTGTARMTERTAGNTLANDGNFWVVV